MFSFFLNATPTPQISPLSLHDALPIFALGRQYDIVQPLGRGGMGHVYLARERELERFVAIKVLRPRSEEHTSELQSPYDLVCRLLLEKKKRKSKTTEMRHA